MYQHTLNRRIKRYNIQTTPKKKIHLPSQHDSLT